MILRIILAAWAVMGVTLTVRMKSMGGTRYVLEGSNVTLSCEFDLEGDDLYSLLWWRDGSVLLRYTSHGEDDLGNETMAEVEDETEDVLVLDPISNVTTRPLTWFPIKGLKATLGEAGRPQELVLVQVDHNSAGVYTCEVTTEAPPTFLTANTSVTVHVVVPPTGLPVLHGTSGVVTEGQWIAAECDSAPALPTPSLAFFINKTPVVKAFMSSSTVASTSDHKRVVSRSVGFPAHRRLFPKGHLLLECRVTIENLVWTASTDLLLEGYDPADDVAGGGTRRLNWWCFLFVGSLCWMSS
ncbi:uncharacterized protein LOC119593262 [Penaeus monodon]|uniref:uncharacterized protein LOC119593262 n=1 Tax=Penaeus monodon TaxID=6687 RepID=UPI0018A6DB5C|nr:uncharacterized protein LOC119593262 [Penaeus monodon]